DNIFLLLTFANAFSPYLSPHPSLQISHRAFTPIRSRYAKSHSPTSGSGAPESVSCAKALAICTAVSAENLLSADLAGQLCHAMASKSDPGNPHLPNKHAASSP